jgi:hypothetical protein
LCRAANKCRSYLPTHTDAYRGSFLYRDSFFGCCWYSTSVTAGMLWAPCRSQPRAASPYTPEIKQDDPPSCSFGMSCLITRYTTSQILTHSNPRLPRTLAGASLLHDNIILLAICYKMRVGMGSRLPRGVCGRNACSHGLPWSGVESGLGRPALSLKERR